MKDLVDILLIFPKRILLLSYVIEFDTKKLRSLIDDPVSPLASRLANMPLKSNLLTGVDIRGTRRRGVNGKLASTMGATLHAPISPSMSYGRFSPPGIPNFSWDYMGFPVA